MSLTYSQEYKASEVDSWPNEVMQSAIDSFAQLADTADNESMIELFCCIFTPELKDKLRLIQTKVKNYTASNTIRNYQDQKQCRERIKMEIIEVFKPFSDIKGKPKDYALHIAERLAPLAILLLMDQLFPSKSKSGREELKNKVIKHAIDPYINVRNDLLEYVDSMEITTESLKAFSNANLERDYENEAIKNFILRSAPNTLKKLINALDENWPSSTVLQSAADFLELSKFIDKKSLTELVHLFLSQSNIKMKLKKIQSAIRGIYCGSPNDIKMAKSIIRRIINEEFGPQQRIKTLDEGLKQLGLGSAPDLLSKINNQIFGKNKKEIAEIEAIILEKAADPHRRVREHLLKLVDTMPIEYWKTTNLSKSLNEVLITDAIWEQLPSILGQ